MAHEAWECVNPLGGDFTNGTYVSLHSAAQGFELAKGVPVSSNAVVEATFAPGRAYGTGFKVAGVLLYETAGRFWHLTLVESPSKYRYCELSEMRDGRWLAHKDLKMEVSEKHGQWKTGKKYRLRIELDGKGADEIDAAAKEFAALQNSASSAARHGYVDAVIDPAETRKHLVYAFEMLFA